MLAYAPRAHRSFSPCSFALVAALHVGVFAAVMMAKTDYAPWVPQPPTDIFNVPLPDPPPPPPPPTDTKIRPAPELGATQTIVKVPTAGPIFETLPTPADIFVDPLPPIDIGPPPGQSLGQVRIAASLRTSGADLRPPYPASKVRSGEEATLRLRLSIDERGRVTAVAPVGNVDPDFFRAAERHIMKVWRYSPANEGGRKVASTTVVTLSFKLTD